MFFVGWEMQYNENDHIHGQLMVGSFINNMRVHATVCSAEIFGETPNHPGDSDPPKAQIWYPVTSGFSQN